MRKDIPDTIRYVSICNVPNYPLSTIRLHSIPQPRYRHFVGLRVLTVRWLWRILMEEYPPILLQEVNEMGGDTVRIRRQSNLTVEL